MNRAGHHPGAARELGVWSAFYVAGIAFLAAQLLLGVPRPEWGIEVYTFLIGLGVYLLDRVGVVVADPDGGNAWPRTGHTLARVGAIVALAAASVVGWTLRPGLALGPWIGLAIVAAYARPGKWRLRNFVWLKGPVVAICLVALGVLAAGADRALANGPAVWITAFGLALLVLGDCVLSDLDDVRLDRASSVGSVAVFVGERHARTVALGLHVLSGAALLAGAAPRLSAGITSGTVVLTTWALVVAKPARVRTIVDLRVPALAVALWLIESRAG